MCTIGFILFYSVSPRVKKELQKLDYTGKLVFIHFLLLAYVACELTNSTLFYTFLFITFVVLAVNVVIIQFDGGYIISFWTTAVIITFIFIYDFFIYAKAKEKEVFYIPMFVESLIVFVGYLIYYFKVPERAFPNTAFVHIYFNGYVIYTILFLNFAFEV